MVGLTRLQMKKLYRYRFSKGLTFLSSFKDWNEVWGKKSVEYKERAWMNYCKDLDCETTVPYKGVAVKGPWHSDDVYDIILGKQEETETTMRYADQSPCSPYACASIAQVSPETSEQKAQQYLLSSLEQATWDKHAEESKAFYMNGTSPQTLGELREALKNGWVTVSESHEDDEDDMDLIFGAVSYISIGDPSKKSDPKGYDKARKLIKSDADEVRDQIMVMGSELGLKTLNEFKAKTYH